MTKLEIACFNEESAVIAAREKVDRIELCESYALGGITPNTETLKKLKQEFEVPVYVMIRPRGGNFHYSDREYEEMKAALQQLDQAGADGFVFGILTENHKIDLLKNAELVKMAKGKPCTFHRAFDEVEDRNTALEQVISCGFTTILSSGGDHPAIQGVSILKELQDQAGDRLTIMAGGGVRSGNVQELNKHFRFVHSAAVKKGTEEIDITELRALKEVLRGPKDTF